MFSEYEVENELRITSFELEKRLFLLLCGLEPSFKKKTIYISISRYLLVVLIIVRH